MKTATTAKKSPAAQLPEVKTLVQEVRPSRQKISLYEIAEIQGHKVKLIVECDTSYDFQSGAHVKVWNQATLAWNDVASLHHSGMKTKGRAQRVADFAEDRAELIRRFAAVVLK